LPPGAVSNYFIWLAKSCLGSISPCYPPPLLRGRIQEKEAGINEKTGQIKEGKKTTGHL